MEALSKSYVIFMSSHSTRYLCTNVGLGPISSRILKFENKLYLSQHLYLVKQLNEHNNKFAYFPKRTIFVHMSHHGTFTNVRKRWPDH